MEETTKEETTMTKEAPLSVVTQTMKKDSSIVSLTREEGLEYQNIQLQRQVLSIQGLMINRQESEWIKKIHGRVGVDISGWSINIETGICTSPGK